MMVSMQMSQLDRELPIPFYLGMTAFNMLC